MTQRCPCGILLGVRTRHLWAAVDHSVEQGEDGRVYLQRARLELEALGEDGKGLDAVGQVRLEVEGVAVADEELVEGSENELALEGGWRAEASGVRGG